MIKSEKKLIIVEIVLSLLFLLNIFVKNILNDYLIILIISVAIGFIIWQMGYEKDNVIDNDKKKSIVKYVIFYTLSFIVLQYGLGLILDFVKTPYKRDLPSIFKNVFATVLIIISSEYLRYIFVKKGENKKIIHVLAAIVFILIDLSLNVSIFNLSKLSDLLEFVTSIFLPSLIKNWILTIFVYRYGVKQNIIYRLLLELYVFIVPFTPDLGIYLKSVFLMTYPLLLSILITFGFEKAKKKDFRDKHYKEKIITGLSIIVVTLLIALNSNLFRYWMVAVASGSMEPTIEIGDMIVIDKDYQKHLDKLKVGDVLVFKIGKKIYTHRIIDIKEQQGNYNISTKGDRKGQIEDNWTVTNKDVIGVVKFKIKYVGYPTVWLSRILEGNK